MKKPVVKYEHLFKIKIKGKNQKLVWGRHYLEAIDSLEHILKSEGWKRSILIRNDSDNFLLFYKRTRPWGQKETSVVIIKKIRQYKRIKKIVKK
jgi:hypothetical protein